MNITHYDAFLKAVELKNITKAAEVLGYTQSGMSQIIKTLEEETGLTLLLRGRNGVKLTSEGSELLPYIKNICAKQRQLNEKIFKLHGIDSGTVRIGCFSSISIHYLPEILKEFTAKYKNIHFELLYGEYYEIEKWVENEDVDFGFSVYSPEKPFNTIPIMQDSLYAILPKNSIYENDDVFNIRNFETENFIRLGEEKDREIEDIFTQYNIHPNTKYRLCDDYAIMSMVERGLGVSLMHSLVLSRCPFDITAKRLDIEYSRDIRIIYKNTAKLSLASKEFVKYFFDH